ncbi:profilin-1-like [Heterodontus francisci]|uniref:profilin-1-like n=1 Tax=Heterodontus francisci TaxID=7792 RepID=UPI00355B3E60
MSGGWYDYVKSLTADGECSDAAIIGIEGTPSIWTAVEGGNFSKITPDQIKPLLKDRSCCFATGIVLGNKKYTLIRDQMDSEAGALDIKVKPGCTNDKSACSAVVIKSHKTLVLLEGASDSVRAGNVHVKAANMVQHLKNSGY